MLASSSGVQTSRRGRRLVLGLAAVGLLLCAPRASEAVGAAFGVQPALRGVAAPRGPAPVMVNELDLQAALSDSFWSGKRARLEAEMAAQLAELEEFQAREQAVYSMVEQLALAPGAVPKALNGAAPAALTGADAQALADLEARLAAEEARTAALTAALAEAKREAEVNLQKTAAFWMAKSAEQKSAAVKEAKREGEVNLQKTAAFWIGRLAEQKSGAAEAPAEAKPAAPPEPAVFGAMPGQAGNLVPDAANPSALLDQLKLSELRKRLLAKGLSTTGIKEELQARLAKAETLERQQNQNWDPNTKSWK